jgi:uncharacterized membrane protein (DUF2068 family)
MRMPITNKRRKGIVVVCTLAIIQCVLRFAFPLVISLTGVQALENPVSSGIMDLILIAFVAIGAVGLVTTYGLWKMRRWGYIGTILLSTVTIAFDLWALIYIQATAAIGLVLPAVFVVYLLYVRKDFAPK